MALCTVSTHRYFSRKIKHFWIMPAVPKDNSHNATSVTRTTRNDSVQTIASSQSLQNSSVCP